MNVHICSHVTDIMCISAYIFVPQNDLLYIYALSFAIQNIHLQVHCHPIQWSVPHNHHNRTINTNNNNNNIPISALPLLCLSLVCWSTHWQTLIHLCLLIHHHNSSVAPEEIGTPDWCASLPMKTINTNNNFHAAMFPSAVHLWSLNILRVFICCRDIVEPVSGLKAVLC